MPLDPAASTLPRLRWRRRRQRGKTLFFFEFFLLCPSAPARLLSTSPTKLTGVGRSQVQQEEQVPHDPLRRDDRGAEKGPLPLPELKERHQVHPLVLGLVQQSVDAPAVVAEHAEGAEVAQGAPYHS